jgi:tetratricopeptide (TPR) repeat protein
VSILRGTLLLGVLWCGEFAAGDEAAERDARSTAVTLNYSRASFHRLRRNPSKRVWLEEQSKILNNLNLNGIADQEVVTLYAAVLDEVGRERIADQERVVINKGYRRAVRQQVLSNAFVLGAQLGTTQYASAVRTGCNSWWDYRSSSLNRDLDLWKVDKTRMLDVVDKSSKFLDTFWKLAQKKNIPDRWLVRGDDLDKLEAALAESDFEVRLRVLQRMERFMECFPPYWYHVARTQQALGQLFAASATYEKLADLGDGHFRKDEMLAAGLANRAAIQSYLRQPSAVQTARKALEYSNGVWQANLVCARVLAQQECSAEAEEAILRNLDVDLERTQSLASLVSLYCGDRNLPKLTARLSDADVVSELPMLLLLRAAAVLGTEKFPAPARQQVAASLYGYELTQFGSRQVVLVALPSWELETAAPVLRHEGIEFPRPTATLVRGTTQLQFASILDSQEVYASTAGGDLKLQMDLKYADAPPVRLTLQRLPGNHELLAQAERQAAIDGPARELMNLFTAKRRMSFLITDVQFGEAQIALAPSAAGSPVQPAVLEKGRPALQPETVPSSDTPIVAQPAAPRNTATVSQEKRPQNLVVPASGTQPATLAGEID